LAVGDAARPLPPQPQEFRDRQRELVNKLTQMKTRGDEQLQEQGLPTGKRKMLASLKNHWADLLVCVEHPAVATDNNAAARTRRNPVTGRKNDYGSGRVWSAQLAAVMFTVLQTVLLWGLNLRHWFQAFLDACPWGPPAARPVRVPTLDNECRTYDQLRQLAPNACSPLDSERPAPSTPQGPDTS
jgi:hypothetical protein